MIKVSHLNKAYGSQDLFKDVNINLGKGEKIGLIGRNGSGKSTFLKMIIEAKENPINEIDIPSSLVIRSMEQSLAFEKNTLVDQVSSALPTNAYNENWKAESILMGLGFSTSDFLKSPTEFSSGFQIRIRLAEALVADSHLLLLDEPTNYLDIVSLRWLSRFLKNWKESFVLVTHDRHFMSEVVTHSIIIHREKMRKMQGKPQKLLDQIKMDEEIYEKTRKNQIKKQERDMEFIRKFRAGARSAGMVQSRIKSLEKQEIGEKLKKIPEIKFNFNAEKFKGNTLLEAQDISFSYDNKTSLINKLSIGIHSKDRIGIIGKNGKGKTTLLKILSEKITPQEGKINRHSNLKIGYFGSDSKNQLIDNHSILEELISIPSTSEQQVRNLCGSLLFSGNAVKKQIKNLSGGEKSRVCLGKAMLGQSHLLMLDEPTNHLDMESCQSLINSLESYQGAVIFVSHDEDMISALANRLIVFDGETISIKNKTYSEFLNDEGWSDEEDLEVKTKNKNSSSKEQYLDQKTIKKDQRINKKSQQAEEKKINQIESKKLEISKKLEKACIDKNYEDIKNLGIELKKIDECIENHYSNLEKLMAQEDELNTLNIE